MAVNFAFIFFNLVTCNTVHVHVHCYMYSYIHCTCTCITDAICQRRGSTDITLVHVTFERGSDHKYMGRMVTCSHHRERVFMYAHARGFACSSYLSVFQCVCVCVHVCKCSTVSVCEVMCVYERERASKLKTRAYVTVG